MRDLVSILEGPHTLPGAPAPRSGIRLPQARARRCHVAREGPGVREGEERQPGSQTLRPYSLGSGGASTAPNRGPRTGVPCLPEATSGLGATRSPFCRHSHGAPLALPRGEDRASFLGAAGLLAAVQQPRDPGTFISCIFPWRKLRSFGPHPGLLKALAVSEPPPALGLDEAPRPRDPQGNQTKSLCHSARDTRLHYLCDCLYLVCLLAGL